MPGPERKNTPKNTPMKISVTSIVYIVAAVCMMDTLTSQGTQLMETAKGFYRSSSRYLCEKSRHWTELFGKLKEKMSEKIRALKESTMEFAKKEEKPQEEDIEDPEVTAQKLREFFMKLKESGLLEGSFDENDFLEEAMGEDSKAMEGEAEPEVEVSPREEEGGERGEL